VEPGSTDWSNPDAATAEVERQLSSMAAADLERLNQSLLFRIEHMVRRIEYAESRRGAIATLAGGLLAAGIALFAILLDAPSGPVRVALGVLATSVLISAALTLVAWFRQTNPPYGFIRADKSRRPWKWFYRDALADHEAFTFDWWKRKDSPTNKGPIKAFEVQWGPFAKRELQLVDLKKDVLQNLQQVYLLHVNEKYKNRFLSQLRTVLLRGVIASILAFVITLAVAELVDRDAEPGKPQPTPQVTQSPN
jgi:hypothetical protein